LRLAVPFAAVLGACLAGAAWAEPVIRDLSRTRIIKSHEAPHNILGEACIACHPREKFDFWLLVYKGRPPVLRVEEAPDNGAGRAPGAERPGNRFNGHDAIACGFCHFDDPRPQAPRFIVDAADLCRLCHPGVDLHRLPEGRERKRLEAAVAAQKLPGAGGMPSCLTCHKIHESTYSMRDDYARLLYEERVPNPHGDRMLCFECHPGGVREGRPVAVAGEGRDALCTGCHTAPGVRQAPHPVGMRASEATWRMEYLGFPLEDGKLTCVTCHDEVSHRASDPANPRFLRGGPYPDREKFCARCHLDSTEAQNNPHRQLDGFGRIRPASCRFCHAGAGTGGVPGPGASDLVADETSVCASCHRVVPHPGVDHLRPLPGPMEARRVEYERRHQVRLPLGEGGVIRCSTCHNPHAKGVIKGEAGVGAGSLWRVPDFREVCAPCHGRY